MGKKISNGNANTRDALQSEPTLYLVRFHMRDWQLAFAVNDSACTNESVRQHLNSWARQVSPRPREGVVVCGLESSSSGITVWGFAYSRLPAEAIEDLWARETGTVINEPFVEEVDVELIGLARIALAVLRIGDAERQGDVAGSNFAAVGDLNLSHYRSLVTKASDDVSDFE